MSARVETVPAPTAATTAASSLKAQAAPVEFARRRQREAQLLNVESSSLKIVAFSDPNDLLSWGIPKWYQQQSDSTEAGIEFTNVYVHNAKRWFGLVEMPGDAHSNYFVSPDVWRVIQCGADHGHALSCK